MKIREMKQAAKENLRGRWFGPFLLCVLYFICTLPANLCNIGSTILNEYVSMVMEEGIVLDALAHLDVAMLAQYASILSVAYMVLYYLINQHAAVGLARYFIRFGREKANLWTFLGGFFKKYVRTMWVMLIASCRILLFTLLLVVPGVVKAIEYSILPHVMADNPNFTTTEIFAETKALMRGCKWKMCCLMLSFVGWIFLGVITLGLAIPFYQPYLEASVAELYHYAKDRRE